MVKLSNIFIKIEKKEQKLEQITDFSPELSYQLFLYHSGCGQHRSSVNVQCPTEMERTLPAQEYESQNYRYHHHEVQDAAVAHVPLPV